MGAPEGSCFDMVTSGVGGCAGGVTVVAPPDAVFEEPLLQPVQLTLGLKSEFVEGSGTIQKVVKLLPPPLP